jgi:phosphoribosylanthranilate isomerase
MERQLAESYEVVRLKMHPEVAGAKEHSHLGCGAGGHLACRGKSSTRRDARLPHRQDACATQHHIQIKICGITNTKDAKACFELGAQLIGLNFYPQSLRYIEPGLGRQIVEALPSDVDAVGVFVGGNAEEIRKTAKNARVRSVQLHGNFSPETALELASEFRVIRVFSTHSRFRPEEVSLFPDCDVLIDAHHPQLRGGTGQTCDWPSARATLAFARFLILSGGLNAQNVGHAIKAVTPHAVDVCSGVESVPGVKDHRAIKDFVTAVRRAEHLTDASSAS